MDLIATHKNTDFDGFASLLAAAVLYPEATPILPRSLNENVRSFYTLHKDLFSFLDESRFDPSTVTTLIVVDTNSWSRLELSEGIASNPGIQIHIWDHHDIAGTIHGNEIHGAPVGAAVSLLVTQINRKGKKLTPMQSTLFLAGIYEDTGNLTFPSTTPEDARATAFLLECGGDLNVVRKFIRPVYGLKQKEILVEMIKNEKRVKVNGFHISFTHLDIEGYTPGLSPVVDRYQEFSDTDATFAFFSERKKNQCMIIGRCNADTLNVGLLLKELGGGGHPTAGSALLKTADPQGIEERIADLIQKREIRSVQISDLMSFPVLTVTSDTLMKEVALILREKGCTALPISDGGTLKGIISRRDFKRAKKTESMNSPVKAFMSRKLIQISTENSVNEATRLMVKHKIGRLPVLKEDRLIGIITRSDIMRYYYDILPE
jgi:tRNA nucleotidyltransferase (CCA-adding enzyme)